MLNFLIAAMTAKADAYGMLLGAQPRPGHSTNRELDDLRRQAKDTRGRSA